MINFTAFFQYALEILPHLAAILDGRFTFARPSRVSNALIFPGRRRIGICIWNGAGGTAAGIPKHIYITHPSFDTCGDRHTAVESNRPESAHAHAGAVSRTIPLNNCPKVFPKPPPNVG